MEHRLERYQQSKLVQHRMEQMLEVVPVRIAVVVLDRTVEAGVLDHRVQKVLAEVELVRTEVVP